MKPWPYPLWLAHRGAGKLAPENTLAAFRLGAGFGYRAFECDVKLSRDGEAFLLHDDTLERTTSGQGSPAEQDWAALAPALQAYVAAHRDDDTAATMLAMVYRLLDRPDQATAVATAAGVDPAKLIDRYGSRVKLMHLKDLKQGGILIVNNDSFADADLKAALDWVLAL